MYSLYRAWLSLGPCPIPPLPTTTTTVTHQPINLTNGAPDVTLQVGLGLTQFSAHRAVLSAHSGYFKAALLNYSDSTPIAVPNVNVDEFSALLTFMYTGYLDLNLGNIYSILLATHILHMPRALEICRTFLLQTQPLPNPIIETPPPLPPSTTTIIKPIPNRKQPQIQQQIFAPTFSNVLEKSELTPFRSVGHSNINQPPSNNKIVEDEEIATTSKENNCVEKIKSVNQNKQIRKKSNTNINNQDSSEKVIVDIACCDGPVRFHRVINKNYGSQQSSNDLYDLQDNEIKRNAAMNKAMTENIREQMNDDENQSVVVVPTTNEMFTCLYCNHTFKSQYCYQKHARRHLNPVSLDGKSISMTISTTTTQQQQQHQISSPSTTTTIKDKQRDVKLLDMNVQYYPCKTCGSKFPSYYFVHKHRKMCHADEMDDNTNKNNEMLPENNNQQQQQREQQLIVEEENCGGGEDSSCGSAQIDVEGVNNDDD